MAMIIPPWIDASYLKNILRNAEEDESIEISNFTVKPGTQPGDNYGSDMFRATVEFSRVQTSDDKVEEQISLIIKVLPYNDNREDMIRESGAFDTELPMLSKTLPKMNEMITSLACGPFSALCLHISNEKPVHIVMDDLVSKGFRLAKRHLGLDLDHCLLATRNLGRFHATSLALKEKEPSVVLENYRKGIYRVDQTRGVANMFKSSMISLSREVANWPELNPRISDKLLQLSKVAWEKGCEVALYQDDDFIVLNHGDFWRNNMMFRYDDQDKPIDHIFVDFQVSHWGSPAEDILYFFGGNPSYEVRFHHRELLIREYHSSLTDTMTKLQCVTKAPSFNEFEEILKKRLFHELLACIISLPVITLEKDKSLGLVDMMEDVETFKHPGHCGKLYRKIMSRALPLFDSMGLLDM